MGTALSFLFGALVGAVAAFIGVPRAHKKADKRIGGQYPILEHPVKHFVLTCLYVAPYVAAAVVFDVVVMMLVYIATQQA